MKCETAIYIGDIHAPFHCKKAVKLVAEFTKTHKPNIVYLMGDIIDFYQLSKFDKDPDRLTKLPKDIEHATSILQSLRNAAPNARFIFREGNHEHRLTKYLWARPEIAKLPSLQLDELLSLNKLGIKYTRYHEGHFYRGISIEHGDAASQRSGYTARGMLDKRGRGGISGHTHRLGSHWRTNSAGTSAWYENGCMCTMKPHYAIGQPDWQQGFTTSTYKDGKLWIRQVPILGGKLFWS